MPGADLEEILPAADLLRRAARLRPSDYGQAKERFLSGLKHASLEALSLENQVKKNFEFIHNILLQLDVSVHITELGDNLRISAPCCMDHH